MAKPIELIHVVGYQSNTLSKCFECGKTYVTKLGFTKHKMFHTQEKHFSCELCGKTLSQY